jgi:hypothetical protein
VIDLREGSFRNLTVLGQPQACRRFKSETGRHFEVSSGTDDAVHIERSRAETCNKRGDAVARELERGADRLFYLGEPRIIVTMPPDGDRFIRFAAEDMASGIEAIDANVLQRASPMFAFQAVVRLGGLEAEYGDEQPWVADVTSADRLQAFNSPGS